MLFKLCIQGRWNLVPECFPAPWVWSSVQPELQDNRWQSNSPRPFLKRCHTANTTERRLPCNLQIEQIYLFVTFLFRFYQMHACGLIHFRTQRRVHICMLLGYEKTLLVNPVPDMLLSHEKNTHWTSQSGANLRLNSFEWDMASLKSSFSHTIGCYSYNTILSFS